MRNSDTSSSFIPFAVFVCLSRPVSPASLDMSDHGSDIDVLRLLNIGLPGEYTDGSCCD